MTRKLDAQEDTQGEHTQVSSNESDRVRRVVRHISYSSDYEQLYDLHFTMCKRKCPCRNSCTTMYILPCSAQCTHCILDTLYTANCILHAPYHPWHKRSHFTQAFLQTSNCSTILGILNTAHCMHFLHTDAIEFRGKCLCPCALPC